MKKPRVVKTVKNAKALKKYALEHGAEVKDDIGNVFNAGGKKIEKKSIPRPDTSIPKKIEPEKPSAGEALLAKTIEDVSVNTAKILEGIQKQISEIQFNAAEPITEWVFDIVRNNDEFLSLKQITAKAVIPKRTIN